MDIAWYVFAFIVAIGVLVTVHEFGHFWVARRLGVKVLRFSVGFGKPLLSWRRGADDTEYVIAMVPLGGYVKMLDEREDDVRESDLPRAFNRQSLGVRTAVVLAGPMFNFLFAILAYWVMFAVGVSGSRAWVGEISQATPAELSGLKSDQEIVEVSGRSTPTWEAVIQEIIAASLDSSSILLTQQNISGDRFDRVLDLGDVVVDDLTRGHFFSALGFSPKRPTFTPILGEIEANGAAASAGLEPGDRIVSADGETIDSWARWVEFVRARPGQQSRVQVLRDGARLEVLLTPAVRHDDNGSYGRIGAGVEPLEHELDQFYATVRYGLFDSAGKALGKTVDTTVLTLRFFWKMLRLEVSLENLSGPISIAQYAGHTAKIGFSKFVGFLAIVSISLGILNLLPIPVLDGGHLLYYFIELLKGKPVSEEAQFLGQRLGIAMLFGLMGLAFYNDLTRIDLMGRVSHWLIRFIG